MFKKIGLDSVPNKGHRGVFNAPFTKRAIAFDSWKYFIYKLTAYNLEFLTISYTLH
jgi:hypothetical protein